jgi:hypothetical protein
MIGEKGKKEKAHRSIDPSTISSLSLSLSLALSLFLSLPRVTPNPHKNSTEFKRKNITFFQNCRD